MIVTTANKIPCENRNTELLLQEIRQISPTIRFYVPGGRADRKIRLL